MDISEAIAGVVCMRVIEFKNTSKRKRKLVFVRDGQMLSAVVRPGERLAVFYKTRLGYGAPFMKVRELVA